MESSSQFQSRDSTAGNSLQREMESMRDVATSFCCAHGSREGEEWKKHCLGFDMLSVLSLTGLNSGARQAGQCVGNVLSLQSPIDCDDDWPDRFLPPTRWGLIEHLPWNLPILHTREQFWSKLERVDFFNDRVARALDGHATVLFLTNESRFRGSRAEKLRNLL